jgi:hypothetical protein
VRAAHALERERLGHQLQQYKQQRRQQGQQRGQQNRSAFR